MGRFFLVFWLVLGSFLTACQSGVLIDDEDTGNGGVEEDGAISVTPTNLDLGIVFVGQSESAVIEVTNIGKKSSDVTLEILGDTDGQYVLSPYTSTPEPGEATEHTLTLTPSDWGNRSVSVVVSDAISEGSVEVVVTAEAQVDADGDGYGSEETGGEDCDDTEGSTYPGADDAWYDGVDSDCEGNDDFDQDGDGFVAEEYGGDDCDDTDPTIYLGADDTWYDGIDSDCAGNDDFDQDADGYPSDAYGGTDCDDENESINPGVEETWYDGIDSDCDEADDFDQDGDGFLSEEYGGDDCDDEDSAINPSATEVWYDGIDSDCDGANDYDQDGDGIEVDDDCDDTDPSILGPQPETLDGTDEDCNGFIDDVLLSDVTTAEIYGPTANIGIGDASKFMLGGDMDDDGVADLVVLSRGVSGGGSTNYGRAWVVSGDDLTTAKGDVSDYDTAVISANSTYYRFGNISGPMVDIDDDGTDDVFASIYYFPTSGSYQRGYGLMFSGDGLSGGLDTGDQDHSFTLGNGDASWVADAGDYDGDGAVDIIVGSPLDDEYTSSGYKSNSGNVALFLGGFADETYDNGDADDEVHGDSSNDWFGYRVLMVDLNDDGYEDILATSPYNDDVSSQGGAVYGFLGSAAPSWSGDAQDEADIEVYGDVNGLGLGFNSIPNPGDNDGDGRLDLVLYNEASGDAWLWLEAGSMSGAYDISDADHLFAGVDGDYASAIESSSDLDGDGDDEIVIGADSDDTAGTDRGGVFRYDYDSSWSTTLGTKDASAVIWGTTDSDYLGTGISGGADLDGDGKDDLVIGAVGNDSGATDGGALFFVPGW